uniref:Midasin n=1 Tax=Coturnix japonica TaxID=93934 RepID=A0A8C2SW72_COTJA
MTAPEGEVGSEVRVPRTPHVSRGGPSMADMRFQLAQPLQLLARRNEKSGAELNRFLGKQTWTQQDRQCILDTLALLLLDKECTLLIGRQLRPVLLDLLERNATAIKAGGQINHDRHERLCVAMSKLVADHPDVLPFALRYFKNTSPVFQRLFLESSDANTVRYGRRRMKLRDLMEASYRFLQKDQSVFRELWDWSVCIPLLRSHDTLVRWYTSNCLALVTCMNDEHKLSFMKKIFSPEELTHFRLKLLEESQMQNVEQALVLANPDSSFWQKEKEVRYKQGHIVSGDLSANVVAVCGIVLPRLKLVSEEQQVCNPVLSENTISRFVLVESACTNLQNLAIAVAFQSPILLEGPIGCGKTTLIEYLAAVTGRTKPPHILKVQLGDQTDSKTLLGMYRCTDVPGEFVWQPGTLTQAVTKGHWILLEDIDYAPLDVISVLIPLLEKKELLIPGRGDCLKVAPGFQFFATRRVFSCGGGWYRQQSSHAALLDKYWTKIHMDNMSKIELKEILQSRYPNLSLVTDHLLDIFILLTGEKYQASENTDCGSKPISEDASESRSENKKPNLEGRELSLRDLLNWCSRIAYNFDSSSSTTAMNIFQEALDCFTAMLSNQGSRLKMAKVIGSKLNISKKKVEFFCELFKPEILVQEQEVSVGRVHLMKKQTLALTQTFAATRPSAVLIEQLAVCVVKGEPVLLVGETGTGKTSTVQYLAHITGHHLRVINMNQQSDTADLLGGYKPVDNKLIWLPLRESFEELFYQTFSRKKNQTFLGHIQTCYRQKRWHDLLKLMQHIQKSAINKEAKGSAAGSPLKEKWEAFGLKLNHAHQQMKMTENALLFAFVEGTLAQAVKKGEWILLDEINLAAAETLECLSGLLEGSSGSLVLLDRGDTEPLVRHPDFRLFACMNPATDVGKRNLPPGIRNRFTELYVEELRNEGDLQILIMDYLRGLNVSKNTVQGIVNFYLAVRKEAETKLVDGTGHRPHYSLRTLCRALRFAASNPCSSIQRSLYEGFCLSFLTQLDRVSHPVVQKLICQHIVSGNIKSLLKQQIPKPQGGRFMHIEGYWISAGDKEPTVDETYVLTPSVKLNLKDIVRVVSAGTHPVLIQGETSVGKTSLIRWLAAATGNHCVRINNHEHTDIQEYIGCYTSDASGKLVFKEGILIDAMRKGYWIVLDELNLAPTDVLEALNRLLDDNRELFITETQEVVKADPHFMLFATQNPPGLYGGRKVLSRAFRNRFVELHFDELPSAELETILHKRCSLPPSYCSKLVKVMLDLQSYRRGSTVFAGKHGFITLRDLFRWAERYRLAEQLEKDYDWLQHLANDGFMLLAGRVRKQEEVDVIQRVIEKHFKKRIYPESLFSEESVKKLLAKSSTQITVMGKDFKHIVWTQGMRRLAVLVGRALEFGEPVLLVGETGCGKTTICQIFAALTNQKLYSVNCHLHMETSDFLGGLRPIRQRSNDQEEYDGSRLFEWCDGPLVLAMKEEGFFLLDEISLADDSVLERLNSVLEAEKTLVLAEKGGQDDEDNEVELLVAGKKFRILATMNPGGDFGKKELSPALRNRFTEIWCPQSNGRDDLIQIVKHNLHPGLSLSGINHQGGSDIAELMMDFVEWLTNQEFGRQCILSVRDILSWVNFMNVMAEKSNSAKEHSHMSPLMSFIHAACLVYIDGIGSGTTSCSADTALLAREKCLTFLCEKMSQFLELTDYQKSELKIYDRTKKEFVWMDNFMGIQPFFIPRGPVLQRNSVTDYALNAGTTAVNAQRLLRALQLNKPILLEGSPGVGKTSLVAALAKASGNCLVRINLSEQTDVTDLFGTDLPVEGGKGGEFAWRDGPLLAALKAGHWIVLDELNLASQSVLEGLNACFDHRAEIYVPELGMNFHVQHTKTKIFGCQNPYRQGGGRKGLPKSFLNRFTQVYVDPLSAADMEFIGNTLFPAIDKSIISKMVAFNNKIDKEVMAEKKWGQKGGPWEFNLRDLFRWCQLMLVDQSPGCYDPGQHVFLVYGERMRTREDKEKVGCVFKLDIFGQEAYVYTGTRDFHITPYNIQIGYSVLNRGNYIPRPGRNLSLLHHSLQSLESIMKCVHMSWMVILVGPAAVGKTSLVELLAHLTGHRLKIMAMNSAMDTTELLGGFEQVDINRPWLRLLEKVENVVSTLVRDSLLLTEICADDAELVLRAWSNFILNYKPKSLGEGGRSVTAELVSKLEGILVLTQRLNNKISSYSKAEFALLVEEFRRLKLQQVQSADSDSLGTFEWVDGMLVQALQCGDWLLMDNVNFCNPSVLDRLNALLEPGGVLTMSERGVIDGTIPTIAPHPNFRLFLSMDPVHGEISRAMRNRGIEIYISGENDGNVLDNLDLKLLLHGLGLVGDSICDALLAVHSETKTAIPGSVSSLSPLLQAAALIVQQMQRGLGLVKSFYRACWEVYGRSQQLQSNQKLVLELVMKHISSLASHENWGDSLLAMGLWPDSLPTSLFTAEDSLLSTVRSDGQVLIYCLNRLNLKNCRTLPLTLQDFQKIMQSTHPENLRFGAVEVDADWVDEMEVLQASVKLFIEKATNQDWTLRVKWLNFLAKNLPQVLDPVRIQLEAGAVALGSFYASPLSSGISNMIKLLQPTMTDEHVMPLDPRWNVQLLDIIRNSINFDTETEHTDQLLILLKSVANRAVLFLDREKRSYTEKNLILSKKPRTSALRMSLDFHKDPGSYSSLPHAVVVNLAAFFELWDVFTLHWVTSTQVALSDDDMHDILYCLLWRDRFWAVSDTLTVDSPGLSLLSLHWHWVMKHLIDRIPQMLIGSDQVSKEIQSVSQQLQNCLANPACTSANMKLLQKSLGRPLPFKDKLGMECFSLVKVLSRPLNILEARLVFGESRWQEKMCCLKTVATGWKMKKALLQADGLILRANHLEDVNLGQLKNLLKAVHSELRAEGLKFSHTEERFPEDTISSQLDPAVLIQLCSRVQLWPAMECMGVLWQYKLTADYVAKAYARRENFSQELGTRSDLIQLIAFSLKLTPAASQQLSGLWHLLHLHEVSAEEMSVLSSQLVNAALACFWSSAFTTDPDYWLTWRPLPATEEKISSKSHMNPSVKGPGILTRAVFSKCFFEILTSSTKTSQWDVSGLPVLSSSRVTLGEWMERAHQLHEVSTALWTNLAVASITDFRYTDSRLQGIMLSRQLSALVDLVPTDLQEDFLNCCEKLFVKDLVSYEYLLKILKSITDQELLPKEFMVLLLTCLQQFFGEGFKDLPETAWRGSFWVNIGLLQIHIWLPQTRFDPAVKREYKLKYAKEELHQLECEWKTNDLSSQLHTGKRCFEHYFVTLCCFVVYITAQPSLEEKMETGEPVEDQLEVDRGLLSKSSMRTVMMVHQHLCLNFARSLWYQQSLPSHQAKHYFSAFISCYQTGACLVSQFYPLIGAEMNNSLLGSQLLVSTILHNTFFEETTSDLMLQQNGPYDFYQHPNIKQVRQCQPVLEDFVKEINRLLQEWPEHPVLLQLLVVIDRIQSFPLSSPLSKFLNGLEILLAKAQDWEENASRALSLRKHLDLVTQLIIQWRKLELNLKTLVNTLQAFIEGSTLGEFHARLKALLVFHCHVLLMPQVAEKGKFLALNVVRILYLAVISQAFQSQNHRIIELPRLEKTLKIIKSNRKECQDVVTLCADSLQYRLPKLTKKMKKMCVTVTESNSFLSLLESLDQFTGDIIGSVVELQSLTFDQTADKEKQKSEAKHIQMQKQRALSDLFKSLAKTGLSYRKGLSWSRSKSYHEILCVHPLDIRSALAAVNNICQLDATFLAEISSAWDGCQKYFYRSLARHSRLQTALLAPAKDIGLGSVERCKGFTAHLLQLLVRQRQSLTALTEQWILLRSLLSCIQEVDRRLSADREYNVALPPQRSFQHWTDKLQQLSMQCVMVLEELSWFIQCCPTEERMKCSDSERTDVKGNVSLSSAPEEMLGNVLTGIPDRIPSELKYLSPVTSEQLPPACRMRNKDQLWLQLSAQLAAMLARVKAVKAEVDKIRQQPCETLFYSWRDFEVCTSTASCLLEVSAQLQGVESLFHLDEEERQAADQMAVVKSLKYIQEEINSTSTEFTAWRKQVLASTSNCNDDMASWEMIKAGHLTKLLDEDISADVESLHVQKVISAVSELVESLKSYGEDCTSDQHKFFNQSCYLLVRLKPMLCKFSDLILFYLTVSLSSHRSTGKLLSVLTSIFTELAQKGFCLPKELIEDEAGEGATQFHDYEEGGIGDGEGTKDVSDKIESEDQIEDSFKKGEEKEKEDQDSKPDIEGEDNAIEMSEDFEGKMHDGEQEKKENDEKSDEEEELDKQMGDLDNAEADDKLDERLWGDEDDDDDEDASSKAEETGPGMDEEDSELVAKDDNLGAGNKDNKKQPPKDEETENQTEDNENKEKIHEQIDENEENASEKEGGDQDPEPAEEGATEEKEEKEGEGEKDADDQEEENTGNTEEAEEEESQPPNEEKKESAEEEKEKGIPAADQGLQPQQEEDKDNPEMDEQVPESEERMEHETQGQTGQENLQSDSAVELAGEASERDQSKEVSYVDLHEGPFQPLQVCDSVKLIVIIFQSFKRKPGQADNERSMGDHNERIHKRLRTIESSSEAKQNTSQSKQNVEEADAFEHIKESSECYDAQTYDVASKEQEKPIMPHEENEEGGPEDTAMETDMQNEDLQAVDDIEELKPETKSAVTKTSGEEESETQTLDSDDAKDSTREKLPQVTEEKPERSKDSTIHTAHQFLMDASQHIVRDPEELRKELERQLETWQTQQSGSPEEEKEAAQLWQRYLVLTAPLSQQLCEQLRLILEPTQAAKLKGDYRTGKRLNMRKVIPYIASQFRKDKIWLRRTKPSKRQYQICLAIDDSSSMIDNHSKQLAYESLAVIGNALTLLEVGQIAVCSFGETVQLLHPFHEQFSDQSGTRILRLCKFQQKKTKIAQVHKNDSVAPETAQLLLIVSDGRGLFLEGKERVTAAVQAAQNANIFVIFVVLDNPNSRDSILDIKVPIFRGPGELPEIRSYMEEFPFPFYMILRDVNALPETLSDALRQWFELVTASDTL